MAFICETDSPCTIRVTGYDNDLQDPCIYVQVVENDPLKPRDLVALNANEAERLIARLDNILSQLVAAAVEREG